LHRFNEFALLDGIRARIKLMWTIATHAAWSLRAFCALVLLLLLGRKTRLDMQNNGCNGNLLCERDAVERNGISSLESHRAMKLLLFYYYTQFPVFCIIK